MCKVYSPLPLGEGDRAKLDSWVREGREGASSRFPSSPTLPPRGEGRRTPFFSGEGDRAKLELGGREKLILVAVLVILLNLLSSCASAVPLPPTPTSAAQIQPVDATHDGLIDENDVLILLGQADQYWDQNIEPLLVVAGFSASDPHQLPDASQLKKLTSAEKDQLFTAIDAYNQLEEQLLATAKEARGEK